MKRKEFPVPANAQYIKKLQTLPVGESLPVSEQDVSESLAIFGLDFPVDLEYFLNDSYGLDLEINRQERTRTVRFTKLAKNRF